MAALGLCLTGACLVGPSRVSAEVSPVTPVAAGSPAIRWHQRTLFIPYHANKHLPAAQHIAEVQLLLSRTGTSDWSVLQSAQPNVQGFNYHAPEDGEYWFALKHLDANGQPLDGTPIAPQLHLLIDTRADLGPINPFSGSAPSDLATSPAQQPAAPEAPAQVVAGNPFQPARPAQDWPVTNQVPAASANMSPRPDTPPIANPYTSATEAEARRTPARFAVDGPVTPNSEDAQDFAANLLNASPPPSHQSPSDQSPSDQLPSAQLPSGQPSGGQPSSSQASAPDADEASEWTSAGRQGGPRLVNARTFDLEYDLKAVGPWGVAKVELFGTQDEGATWQSFGVDPDNRSPIRVTVPESGTYGFRILVEGANTFGVKPPQAGDKPELVVMVDLESPEAQIVAVEPGVGDLADQLRIRWQATDTNLEHRPVALFYSSFAEGPWSTIASGLENTGSYVWRIERHIPGRFFLRLEVRDSAGNVATYHTPEPITLNRAQPTGTLLDVRPVTDVPVVGK